MYIIIDKDSGEEVAYSYDEFNLYLYLIEHDSMIENSLIATEAICCETAEDWLELVHNSSSYYMEGPIRSNIKLIN